MLVFYRPTKLSEHFPLPIFVSRQEFLLSPEFLFMRQVSGLHWGKELCLSGRHSELVIELIGNWEEAARLLRFVKVIEEEAVRSDFSEAERNDIQKVADWTKEYADSLDPLCDLPEAIEEFVRPESAYCWLE